MSSDAAVPIRPAPSGTRILAALTGIVLLTAMLPAQSPATAAHHASSAGLTTSFDLDLAPANPTILSDGTAKFLPGAPGLGFEAAGIWKNALTDRLGGPLEYVDTAGVVSGLTHYDPYGVPRPGSSPAVGIGFAGEWRDATGLLNLRARSYDLMLGRFVGRLRDRSVDVYFRRPASRSVAARQATRSMAPATAGTRPAVAPGLALSSSPSRRSTMTRPRRAAR